MRLAQPRIEIAALGTWARAALVAEYDPTSDTIRIDSHALEIVRARLGDVHAERFAACAVAHERFHRERPRASEADAHAFARATTGADPLVYEAVLRDARRRA